MSLTVTLQPKRTIDSVSSDVNAALSQLPYKFKIDDTSIVITTASASGTGTKFFTLSNPSGVLTAGDVVFIDDDLYPLPYNVISVAADGFVTDAIFAGTVACDFSVLQENHRIEINIYDSSGTYLLIPEAISVAIAKLETFFNLSAIIESYLLRNNLIEVVYVLKYREAYTGLTPPSLTALDSVLAIRAKRQLLSNGGSNMKDLLLKDDRTGKLLTLFETPLMWNGWRRKAAFIIDSNAGTRLSETTINLSDDYYTANKVFATNEDTDSYTLASSEGVQVWTMVADISQGIYRMISIEGDSSGDDLLEAVYYKQLSEARNPICIEWLNSLGGYDQHVFELNQEFREEAEDSEIYQLPINDNIETVNNILSKRAAGNTQFINMVAENLTIDQIRALHEIKSSDDVRLWLSKDGTSYINVVASESFDTVYETDGNNFEYSVTIQLPKDFDFNLAKEY
jgi:hypothetical protein